MVEPLWVTTPKAIKWFNYRYSLPKVWLSSLKVMLGLMKIGASGKPLVVTCSISEDYARLWLYFAKKNLGQEKWEFLIVDSSGDMDASNFEGGVVIRFLNLYHGKKVDILLRKLIQAEIIFLCDDDKYILKDVSEHFTCFQDTNTPVVSLSPRSWWKFEIQGQEFMPMGSYAVLFKKNIFLDRQLRFQSPPDVKSQFKVFPSGVKPQPGYDTADYANERLLLLGYNVVTLPNNDYILGFDGLSGRRILLLKYGKVYIKQALLEAKHYQEGTTNWGTIRSLYGVVKLEHLYRQIFHTPPQVLSGFSEGELRDIVERNPHVHRDQKEHVFSCFEQLESTYRKLVNHSCG